MLYEYKVVHTQTEMNSNQLNVLNKKGWELVSVVFIEYNFTYYFKKEVKVKVKNIE